VGGRSKASFLDLNMASEERVFRHSPGKLALMSLGVVGFVFIAYFLRDESYSFIVVVIFVASLFVFLAYITSRVKISDEEIIVNGLLGSKSLKWSQIGHVSTRRQSLRLHDRDENVILSLDPQLEGYIEILDLIFSKRPDLFDLSEDNVLSRTTINHVVVIGFSLMLILFAALFYIVQDQDMAWIFALVFLGLGLYVILAWFLSPQSITLENQTLFVKYLFKETTYKVTDINAITLEKRRTKEGYIYFVQLNLKIGKPVRLSGFKQGSALTYQILKRWHEKANSGRQFISNSQN
jgi:hypothetical protein